MSSNVLGIGVAGCGGIANVIFAESAGLDCLEPTFAFDPDLKNLHAFCERHGFRPVESFEELLASDRVQAVVLTGPSYVRRDQIVLAAAAGKAIFTEKPLALSIEAGREAVRVCREAGVPMMVGHVLRYFGGFAMALEAVEKGLVGTPQSVSVLRFGPPFPDQYRNPWRLKKQTSGGLLYEIHVHELDFARRVLGNPKSVQCQAKRFGTDPETDFEDLYLGTIGFENGTLAQFHFGQSSAYSEARILVSGSQATLSVGFSECTRQPFQGEREVWPVEQAGLEPPYRKELRLFAEAVLSGAPVPVPGEEGFWAIAMAEAIEISAREQRAVEVETL